ncbi:hypothetical protein HGA13_20500 [Nocardia speluncae]|uniref:Uncharacterized protein n=1 Tax=Nocardia speluncae TaxID=419477 RepID=A0A846XGD7_9NOCA|nr:hypothetical protein [Nocardia speluncae]NKY35431.1 hypothetical protein [Nocardia speluncae]
MAAVTGEQVAAFLGQATNTELVAMASAHAVVITSMVRAYTRDGGFTANIPNAEIEAVIVTATSRLVANPEQLDQTVGSVGVRGGFTGFNLAELAVLNRYRKRAA